MTESLKQFKRKVVADAKPCNVLPKTVYDPKRERFKDKPEKPAFKKLDDADYIPRLSDYNRGREE